LPPSLATVTSGVGRPRTRPEQAVYHPHCPDSNRATGNSRVRRRASTRHAGRVPSAPLPRLTRAVAGPGPVRPATLLGPYPRFVCEGRYSCHILRSIRRPRPQRSRRCGGRRRRRCPVVRQVVPRVCQGPVCSPFLLSAELGVVDVFFVRLPDLRPLSPIRWRK